MSIEDVLMRILSSLHVPEWDDDKREDFDIATREEFGQAIVAEIHASRTAGRDDDATVADIVDELSKVMDRRRYTASHLAMMGPQSMRHTFVANKGRKRG